MGWSVEEDMIGADPEEDEVRKGMGGDGRGWVVVV